MTDWFWRNWWGEAKASPQLRILNVYSFGVLPQAFIVQPEGFVLLFQLSNHFFEFHHPSFLSITRCLGSDTILQFSSKCSFLC